MLVLCGLPASSLRMSARRVPAPSLRMPARRAPATSLRLCVRRCLSTPPAPPRKRDIGEYIYNLGAFTSLSSFMVTDMLALRGLQIAGGCMSLFYHSTRSPPAMSPIAWCLLFMGVNAVNLGRLLLEEATVSFTEEELDVFEAAFHPFGVTPRQMRVLFAAGRFADFAPEADGKDARAAAAATPRALVREGEAADRLMLLTRGRVSFRVAARDGLGADRLGEADSTAEAAIARGGAGDGVWIGDVEFLEHNAGAKGDAPAAHAYSASVTTRAACRALVWDAEALRAALAADAKLREAMRELLGGALAAKVNMMHLSALRERTQTYTQALATACADGKVVPAEKRALEIFRARAGLSEAAHADALRTIGWTDAEYRHGARSHKGEPVEAVLERLGLVA